MGLLRLVAEWELLRAGLVQAPHRARVGEEPCQRSAAALALGEPPDRDVQQRQGEERGDGGEDRQRGGGHQDATGSVHRDVGTGGVPEGNVPNLAARLQTARDTVHLPADALAVVELDQSLRGRANFVGHDIDEPPRQPAGADLRDEFIVNGFRRVHDAPCPRRALDGRKREIQSRGVLTRM